MSTESRALREALGTELALIALLLLLLLLFAAIEAPVVCSNGLLQL
jgi:hypothetical protein